MSGDRYLKNTLQRYGPLAPGGDKQTMPEVRALIALMQEAKATGELERALAAEAALVAARRDVEQLTAQIEGMRARAAAQQAWAARSVQVGYLLVSASATQPAGAGMYAI